MEILHAAAQLPEGKTLRIKRFHLVETEVGSIPCLICGTGYTGEEGVEIYCHRGHARQLAEMLVKAGQNHGLALVGLGARDSLRLEAGLPLYGHELADDISPLEGGIGWTVKLSKPGDFIGKEALRKQHTDGPPRRLVFFTMDDKRIAREGASVFSGETEVGRVVSGTQSPILNRPIGSALIASDADPATLEADIRGKRYLLNVKKPPLHRLQSGARTARD